VKSADDIEKVKRIFKIKSSEKLSKENLKDYLQKYFVESFAKGLLSPGAMSNSPDRFDGYHSDGACCRHESDKGRHKSNLQRYGQDRRVYENWADGDWKMADRLMSLFRKNGISADHIGPISLGFCHRPKFHPLTKAENSAKNNRMNLKDVQVLLADEQTEQVVSWHSKFIWDKLKSKVVTDADAKNLSDLMRKNLHHILIVFSMIDEKGYREFLEQFLNPEYSFFDYKFEGFNPETGLYINVVPKNRNGQNQQNNIKRYYRVAFDKLKEYKTIENRKTNIWKHKEVDNELEKLFVLLKAKKHKEAKVQLENILIVLANNAESSW
jgi:Alw26I/Eco31I/Esp3I family type II restriction endonuclease